MADKTTVWSTSTISTLAGVKRGWWGNTDYGLYYFQIYDI
jgi:hypothetical protein